MAKVAISVTGVDGGRDDTDVDRWMPRMKLINFLCQLPDKLPKRIDVGAISSVALRLRALALREGVMSPLTEPPLSGGIFSLLLPSSS